MIFAKMAKCLDETWQGGEEDDLRKERMEWYIERIL